MNELLLSCFAAQDLLHEWVNDKLDLDTELEYSEDTWNRKTETSIKREWDHLLHRDDDYGLDLELESGRSRKSEKVKKDPYRILHEDQNELVDSVLQGMLDKEIIKDDFTKDLGLEKHRSNQDPKLKMQLRHQQVKENREKKTREKQQHLKEQQDKKDAMFKARQMMLKEEKQKEVAAKKEETEIQKEMARIRKQMEEEKRRKQEQKERERREREELELQATEEILQKDMAEHRHLLRVHQEQDDRKRQRMRKIQEVQARQTKENLKLLQTSFSAWYGVVIERRLAAGRATAMADWKLLRKTFKAWKAYIRDKTLAREEWAHKTNLTEQHRKMTVSGTHYRLSLLRRCMTAWLLYVKFEQNKRQLNQMESDTKNKMAAFLEAASSGRLASDRTEGVRKSLSLEDLRSTTESAREKVDAIFAGPTKRRSMTSNQTDVSSARSRPGSSRHPDSSKGVKKPTQAWQVTREHLHLSKKQIRNLGQGDNASEQRGDNTSRGESSACSCKSPHNNEGNSAAIDEQSESRSARKPWQRAAPVIDKFENRHNAQQKILHQQQEQIKEQRRLIEEMQYVQKQQLLSQQLAQQQLLQVQLNTANPSAVGQALQTHLTKLQKSLEEKAASLPEDLRIDIKKLDSDGATADGANSISTTAKNEPQLEKESAPVSSVSNVTPSSTATVSRGSLTTAYPASTHRTNETSTTHNKHAAFLKAMDDRAAERTRLKREREEKRRKQEEEKMAKLLAEEEERKKEIEEEKRQKVELYKEKKRLEKQRELDRQKQQEKLKELNIQAEQHNRRALLKYRGWHPWTTLVAMAREKTQTAEMHYQKSLLKKCTLAWHRTVSEELAQKRKLADNMYNYLLISRCLNNWKQAKKYTAIQAEKARRFYQQNLLVKILRAWADYTENQKMAMWRKERQAREHDIWRIKRNAFKTWQRYPELLREEQDKEKRREEMRRKVAFLLPDYERVSLNSSTGFSAT